MNRKINIYLMYIIAFLQGLVFYGPVATLYRQSRGLTMYNIFLIESIFMVLMLVFEIPWGWFADRFGYKTTLGISNFLVFVSKIVFYRADSFALFLMERVLMALAFSGTSGCDIALIYSSIDEEVAEKVFGIYTACSSAGFLAASLISSVMVIKTLSFTVACTIIPYGMAAVLTFFIKDVAYSSQEKPSIKRSLKDVLLNKEVIIIVFAAALIGEVNQSIGVFLNQLQYVRSGIDIALFGILTAIMQIACLASAKTYKATKKFGQRKTLQTMAIGILVSCIPLAYTKNPVVSVLLILVIQGGTAVTRPIVLDIENKAISNYNRATVLSIYAMGGDIIASVVNIFIGKSADISVGAAFFTCTVISAIGCLLTIIYFRKVSTQ